MNLRRIVILFITLFTIALLLNGCIVVRSGPVYTRTVPVTPSTYAWYYYPDSGVYYNISQHYYYYPSGSVWYKSYAIPSGLTLYVGNRVRLQISGLPYIKHQEHYRRYPPRHRERRVAPRHYEQHDYYEKRRGYYDEKERHNSNEYRRNYRESNIPHTIDRGRNTNSYNNGGRESHEQDTKTPVFRSPYIPKSGETRNPVRSREDASSRQRNTTGSQNPLFGHNTRDRRAPSQPATNQGRTQQDNKSQGRNKLIHDNHNTRERRGTSQPVTNQGGSQQDKKSQGRNKLKQDGHKKSTKNKNGKNKSKKKQKEKPKESDTSSSDSDQSNNQNTEEPATSRSRGRFLSR